MKHPVIYIDMHHQGLYKSMQMLVENRLGGTLLRPIGTEWFEKGLWMNSKIYGNHPDTIKQYLEIRNTIPTKMGPRNNVIGEDEGYYLVENSFKAEKAITYEQFMKAKDEIDIIMASYYDNVEPYHKLAKELGKKACMQMGNVWPVPWDMVDNVLASTGKFQIPPNKHVLFYHQEIDLKTFYKGDYAFDSKLLVSFVNCLAEHDIHKQSWEDFQALEKIMPEYTFKSYGIENRDGTITEQKEVADIMRKSKFGIQLKGFGDGMGHTIHDFAALGKPVIFRGSQYKEKLAEPLLKHKITGLDLDLMSLEEVANFIKNMDNEAYQKMCDAMYSAFKQEVDFDKEEQQIREFLSKLK